jgi:hypothetical protein
LCRADNGRRFPERVARWYVGPTLDRDNEDTNHEKAESDCYGYLPSIQKVIRQLRVVYGAVRFHHMDGVIFHP